MTGTTTGAPATWAGQDGLDGLSVTRDPAGRATSLVGEGVRHRRRELDDGWTVVDDPAGATALRQDEERTELLRDGMVLGQARLRGAEEWRLPGSAAAVRLERDDDGEVCRVLVDGRAVAVRADDDTDRVLRWPCADVGHGPAGLTATGRARDGRPGARREWTARAGASGLSLGRDTYRFDAEGRVVEHSHPAVGVTRYHYAGGELASVDTPTGRVGLLHGPDGRVRVRRALDGRTTYGYDEDGRRVRESGPAGVRRLAWDALDRLVEVQDDAGWTVRYDYDGFGRRVRRVETGRTRDDPEDGAGAAGVPLVRLEHRDLQGRVWALTDEHGRAVRSFVWDRHRCLAAFDGPVTADGPDVVYVTAPSGVPVGFVDRAGAVHELPATPFAEERPPGHPALWFHLADERTGYVHLTQRDVDPATWQFLSPDPYRPDPDDPGHGDADPDRPDAGGPAGPRGHDPRRRLLGAQGPLAHERDPHSTPYSICGFDPVRRVDPNGAVSAGTVLWQIFGGLTWHLPAHTINWLWIHPVVNLSFGSILAWLPALGFDPRGSYDSWWEFWLPSNYSYEESERQDIGSELMAGWMSANQTFTFQNAIWGRRREWDTLRHTASLQPDDGTPFAQQRPGSLLRITRGDNRAADVVDDWTMVADGIDAAAAATRRYDIAGGKAHLPILGTGRDRVLGAGNLHLFRQVRSAGVNLPGTDPNAPTAGPVPMHARATAIQECAPGAACAQVTLRTTAQLFTYTDPDPAVADGDVIRLGGVLALVTAVQRNATGTSTELSVRAGNATLTLPAAGPYTAQWATPDAGGVQSLAAFAGDTTRLVLPDTVVGWTPGSIARLDGAALAPVATVESHLPVLAQAALAAGADVVPLGTPVVVAATLEPDERLRVADGAVGANVVLRLTRGGAVRLARVLTVANDPDPAVQQDLLTLDRTPSALGLPGAGDPQVAVLATQPVRGQLVSAVAPGNADAVVSIAVNTALGANIAGLDVGGALAVLTGAETRVILLGVPNPVAGAGPWDVARFTFPPGARSHAGTLSGPLEIIQLDAGDAAATFPNDALLRFRQVPVPLVPAVPGLVRVSGTVFTRPGTDNNLASGALLAVAAGTTAVVAVADLAPEVTLDRLAGALDDPVTRVCTLASGERTYDVVRVAGTVRLTGTTPVPAASSPALLPDWVAGDIVRLTVGGITQEWVLDAAPDGGRLTLRGGPGAIPGNPGDPGTVQRLAPVWPPLARAETEQGRASVVLAPGVSAAGAPVSRHRWVTGRVPALATTVGIEIAGVVFVARVVSVDLVSVRTSPLPAAPFTGYVVMAASGATDRVSARWHLVGDEIRNDVPFVSGAAGPVSGVLDVLGSVVTTAVTPKQQALLLPAEPENPRWIVTALEALREHELRHTVQASMWGPLFLGLPLGVVGDMLWDLRGGSGKFEASPFEAVTATPEETGDRPRPAGFQLTAPTGQFRLAVGEVVELELDGKAWRTVITAVDQGAGGRFWVQNLPPDGLGDTSARARTLHHTDPQGDGWLKAFRIVDLVTNAHLMEFTSGLIFEGLIGMFWRAGRVFDYLLTPSVDVTVTGPGRVTLHAADAEDLAKLRLDVGSEVIVDSKAAVDDSVRSVVTAIAGLDVTIRDAVPQYAAGERIRLWRGQGRDPDDLWDLRAYRVATLETVAGQANGISVPGSPAPELRALDVLAVKWTGSTGKKHSQNVRVTTALGGDPPRFLLDSPIDLDGADPDTLRISQLRNDDDPATQWFDTAFYETPIRIRRVTKYLFDPWRALTLDTGFTQPADGSTFKTVLAWIARGVRYAVSNRTWTPWFGYVWWTTVFGNSTNSTLEQSASWNGGDLYSTITRSGDPRFAASEGGHGEGAGSYGIFEGEFLRMWTWESWRWNDVFASQERTAATVSVARHVPSLSPALVSALAPVSPWDDRWRITGPAAGIVPGLEYPAELAAGLGGTFRPSPLLQIPTRADISRTSGIYFVACQAGAWRVGVANPTGADNGAQNAGAQFHTRTVQVQPLDVTGNGTALPWQAPGAPAALTLFLTESATIVVGDGPAATYRVRLLDPVDGAVLFRTGDLSVRARITPGATETVEIVRVHDPADPYFATFGSYLAQPVAVPVRRFQVTVSDTITLRSGPDATSPVASVAAPVAPGTVVSALLPVTTSVSPTVVFNGGPPVGAPPLPVITGPLPAGNLHRYDIAVDAQPPEQSVTLDVTFRFADPHPAAAGATADVLASFAVQPEATLAGPTVVPAGTTIVLTVVPADGTAVAPADVTLPAGGGAPVAGVTVVVNAAGALEVAAAAGILPVQFVVRALWRGRPVRRSVQVA